VKLHVKLGDVVQEGQLLATLDDGAIRLQRERVIAELAQIEADLAAQETIHQTEVLAGVLRSSSALADENAARVDVESFKTELERVTKLREEHLVDAATETEVRRNYLAAAARMKVFETRRAQTPELYVNRGVRAQADARVLPYREAIKAKRAAVAELDYQLAQYELRSPIEGTVALLARATGDVVTPGTEVVRVVSGRLGHLVATVPEERARNLKPGIEITVRTSRGLLSRTLRGTVVEVGPSVEELPLRSWLSPQWPRWGRRAVIKVDGETPGEAGERVYVQF
jgi:HlyD family secretion protein